MSLARCVLDVNDNLPIKTDQPVHSGKVRSVYWLTASDSARLIRERGYDVAPDTPLAIMVISDRLSAFDCIWKAEGGLRGVPGKGAAFNAISNHWFKRFKEEGLADSHILEVPHPFVWIVQKASPIKVEAIARNYITGSMWRAYDKGERVFCGLELPEGLKRDTKLSELMITPSTKGVLKGIPGVPESDDVNVTRTNLEDHFAAFNFASAEDISRYETLLEQGFRVIESDLAKLDQIFVDTKFEFGYVHDSHGQKKMIYMDEVGTPDSSRIWDGAAYRDSKIIENSKEGFRQKLLAFVADADVLLNKDRMAERLLLAESTVLPAEFFESVSQTYITTAEKIIGTTLERSSDPFTEIVQVLGAEFDLIN